MKILVTTLTVLVLFLATPALADDADDVKEALLSLVAAVNAGDTDTYVQFLTPQYSDFGGNSLLRRSTSQEQRNALQASVDAGVKRNYQIRHLEARVYGDSAVVTGYLMGTRIYPDGRTVQLKYQRTAIWVKQGGKWREAHRHQSPLSLPQ